MPFGYGAANVLSGSMEPAFSAGTLLIIKEEKETKPGEIVVYQAEEELIVHRVISVEGDIIVTKGDANTVCDRPFRSDALKGRVLAWIPYVGAIANILENVVPLLTALILVTVVVRRIRNNKMTGRECSSRPVILYVYFFFLDFADALAAASLLRVSCALLRNFAKKPFFFTGCSSGPLTPRTSVI